MGRVGGRAREARERAVIGGPVDLLATGVGDNDKASGGGIPPVGPVERHHVEAAHSTHRHPQGLGKGDRSGHPHAKAGERSGSDADDNADALTGRALHALESVAAFDAQLASTIEVLQGAQAQLQDAAHTLGSYLNHTELDPQRLQALDERLAAWMSLARRYRRPPEELPALLAQWQHELRTIDADRTGGTGKGGLDRSQQRAARPLQPVNLAIGVEHGHATRPQHRGDGRFAHADRTGQPDSDHAFNSARSSSSRSRGGAAPKNSSNASAACPISISRPSTVAKPRAAAARSSPVSSGA